MHYPSVGEYTDALHLGLDRVLTDPLLRLGTLRVLGAGQPLVRGGTFALTFEVATQAGRYALRCFHKELDSLEHRYAAIERHLERVDSPCMVKLSFQRDGIKTESGTFPVVRMDWAEGSSLSAFVADNRRDPGTLQQLRQSLRHLAAHLRAIGVAHGDIQPSNVIVQRDGSLCLIDYDGLFVPGLADYGSAEVGQRNFQHPGRRSWHYDAGLDAFSFAVLDFALDALRRRPELWQSTRSGEDAFLLRATDYLDPASSPIFDRLACEPGLESRTRDLASICASPYERIPSFESFLTGHDIPVAPIRFSAAGNPRPTYLATSPLVNGADFAQCCRHVGDRVEVVGRVVRVLEDANSIPGATCLRVEYGVADADTVSLRVWPEALPEIDDASHESWVGQWISAVGLVEPVSSEPADAQRGKHASISITEPGQLQWLPEAEAQHRLKSQLEWSEHLDVEDVGVRTEPASDEAEPMSGPGETEAAPLAVEAEAASGRVDPDPLPRLIATPDMRVPPEKSDDQAAKPSVEAPHLPRMPAAVRPDQRRQWWPWVAVLLVGSLGAYLLVSSRAERDQPMPAARTAPVEVSAVAPAQAPVVVEDAPPVAAAAAPAPLVFQEALQPAAAGALNTVAGSVRIEAARSGSCMQLLVGAASAVDGLCEEVVEIVHRAIYPDREVLTGFTRCDDAAAACRLRRPFWLELRADSGPVLRRMPDLWAGSGTPSISASDQGVQVDLGTWHGERRLASLTAAGNVVVERTRVPARPLGPQDCSEVARALENCATGRECGSFADSAQRIPATRWSLIERAYHESTGLDVVAFKALCIRSCEFGFTPSRALIRRLVCNGAPAEQWSAAGVAAGLTR